MSTATERAPAPVALAGAGVLLRYPCESDADALFRLASDPEVTRFFSWGPYRSRREAGEWIATLPGRREEGSSLEFAIVREGEGLVGITCVSEISRRDRRCVVGTWIGRRQWGTGVNGASKALVAHFAFEQLRVERLGAYADVRNLRSQRALERVGFQREGVLRAFHRHGDVPRDVISYSLLRAEWRHSTAASGPVAVHGSPPAPFICAER
jgi:ribosomal-protein-alanine N-acetyltransferase